MGKNSLKLTLGMAGLAVGMAPALAADFLPPPVPEPPVYSRPYITPVPEPVEIISGWYLRADVGYTFLDEPAFAHDVTELTGVELDGSTIAGVGFGYHYTRHIRGDLTFEYITEMEATGNDPFYGGFVRVPIHGGLFLTNGYFDLGDFFGITPYVGGGIGMSVLEARTLTHRGGSGDFDVRRKVKSNFAWALTGGVNYRVNANWSIDANYRLLDLGSAWSMRELAIGTENSAYEIVNIRGQEARIGLRYDIN